MQSYTYYFLQPAQAAEINASFTGVETAINRAYTDLGMVGVLIGGSVNEYSTPNLTVDVSAAVVIDQTGQRIRWSSIENVDCSVDENGTSTAVGTPGNSKYLSVFAKFIRAPSDPRVDGERQTIYFNQAESFELRVAQGAEAGSPTPPALRSDQILLADILIDYGKTQIFDADIDMVTRRQWAITASSAALTIARGQIDDAFQDVADAINTVSSAAGISYAGSGNWADGTNIPAGTVEAAIDQVVSDLADNTGAGSDGAGRVGADAQTSGSFSVAQADISAQILELLGHIDTVNAFANSGNWADATGISATAIEPAINEVKNDLASGTASISGVRKVGAEAQAVGIASVSVGSIYSQLTEILTLVNAYVEATKQMAYLLGTNYVLSAAVGTTSARNVRGFDFDSEDPANRWAAVCDDYAGNPEIRKSDTLMSGWTSGGAFAGTVDRITDIAWSADLSLWCVVGRQSAAAGAAIETSPDLSTWTSRTPTGMTSAGDHAQRILWSAYHSYFVVSGDNSKVIRSSDGATWAAATTPPGGTVFFTSQAQNPTTGDIILAGGTPGKVYRSADGGDTWADVSPTASSLFSAAYDPVLDRFWVSGDGGVFISTTVAGTAWTDVTPSNPVQVAPNYRNLSVSDKGTVIIADSIGMYATLDGGLTWGFWDFEDPSGDYFSGSQNQNLHFLSGRFIGGSTEKFLAAPTGSVGTVAT